ncbi:hypothetical protein PDESU_06287 [Pontiella desulfatans]|uniref:Alpha-galactosidase n=1 Tax=Pontiella desulfatans TaxID=2750659 RepID=A0A6C2UC86_PONDE|nr:hypothetical protein [Pontiella desulfatans]VGO17685.1 hypothetical protein PDESU_06287 [Pontiella desulfatans]
MNRAVIESRYLKRELVFDAGSMRSMAFYAGTGNEPLADISVADEATVTIDGIEYVLGSTGCSAETVKTPRGQQLIITCGEQPELSGVVVKLVYEAFDDVPALTKHINVENEGPREICINGIQVERIKPLIGKSHKLLLEDDYVRDALTVDGKRVYSPWIEKHRRYIDAFLNPGEEAYCFAYPVDMDWELRAGERFESFKVYEFVVPNTEEAGLAVRKATRALFPWTCDRALGCSLAPASKVEEYYVGIDRVAEAGFEYVHLNHGWIKGVMTSPLFTNYSDYALRPELFQNGWDDIRKLSDYAHAKGLQISFYSIYVNTWMEEGANTPKAYTDHDWELIWADDDDSSRWGTTLDPAAGWGEVVNRKLSEAIDKGGFDAYHLDGPYYGDISVAENRSVKPGGPNQMLAWEYQKTFYERMKASGIHGEAAQGFQAFAHGMSRITTTGYEEGDFGDKPIQQQILANRKAAYDFTKLYRPEQATTVLPIVAWSPDEDAPDLLVPMEEHADEYNAYLANVYGYGFEGKPFCKVPFEGPKSKAVVQRWLTFWKDHSEYFKQGYLLHLKKPDGEHLDAVMHLLDTGREEKALVVVYNPAELELSGGINLSVPGFEGREKTWGYKAESGATGTVEGDCLPVSVPPSDATWYELWELKEQGDI